jgi:DNA-binding XRE family transcriptional regulator
MVAKEAEHATQNAGKLRPTSKSLKGLRARLGLTQAQFGQLLGVSGQAVVQWAGREGRVRMRTTTLAALARIQNIGKREARRRLEEMAAFAPVHQRVPKK